jgi:hypothetical protein
MTISGGDIRILAVHAFGDYASSSTMTSLERVAAT